MENEIFPELAQHSSSNRPAKNDPPLQSGSIYSKNPLFESGLKWCIRSHFRTSFNGGFSSWFCIWKVVGRPTVQNAHNSMPKPTFWQWVDPLLRRVVLCWTIAGRMLYLCWTKDLILHSISLTFAGRKESLCWTNEVVPTHFSRVGRISGSVKKLCIPQTPKVLIVMILL